jgi:hypothetical protein
VGTRRVTVYMPEAIGDTVIEWAKLQKRSESSVVAFLVELGLAQARENGTLPKQLLDKENQGNETN